jgi:hypothetical protein
MDNAITGLYAVFTMTRLADKINSQDYILEHDEDLGVK